jgi:uncharacterized protein YecT (DUF1311 family)
MNDVKSWVRRGSLAAMLLIAASYSGYTLAIDCTAVTSNIDKVVCSQLSNQDAKLNEDYSEAMNWLSPEGQSALRADQRAWLRYRVTACGFADGGNSPGDVGCLSALIRRRDDRLLWLVAHQDRPSLFTYFIRSSYETTPDPSGGLPFWSESSTPQIDSKSLSPNLAWSDVQTWNALIAKLIGGPAKSSVCPGGKGDIYREPHVYVASILLITVTEDRDDTCRGLRPNLVILRGQGPLNDMLQDHFMSETQYNVVMMRGDVHLLQASDLFSAGDAWKRLLTERVEQEVQKQALGHRENWHPSADAIERVATDPSNWLPGNTFSIRVSQSALSADEMIGGFTVRIPWSDLQSVLSFKGKRIVTAPNW